MRRCEVCGCKEHRRELVDDVLHIEDDYVLVKGIPALVCERCGEHTITSDDAESVRVMIHEGTAPNGFVEMKVFNFVPLQEIAPSRREPAYSVH